MQHRRASGKDPPILRAQTGQVWVPAKERLGYAAVSNKGSLWPSTHACTHLHMRTHVMHAEACTHAHVRTYLHMCMHATHAEACTHVHTPVHTYVQHTPKHVAHAHACTRAHAYLFLFHISCPHWSAMHLALWGHPGPQQSELHLHLCSHVHCQAAQRTCILTPYLKIPSGSDTSLLLSSC